MEQSSILLFFILLAVSAIIVFTAVFSSSLHQDSDKQSVKNPLKKRFWFFLILSVILGIFASATIPKSPYFVYANETPSKVIHVATMQFLFFMSEKNIDPKNPSGESIELPVDKLIEFRVTSLDVNHGFAIYNSDMKLITQTQAMPGYVNVLRYKFSTPGEYRILCLEYCGMGHHAMQTSFKIK